MKTSPLKETIRISFYHRNLVLDLKSIFCEKVHGLYCSRRSLHHALEKLTTEEEDHFKDKI